MSEFVRICSASDLPKTGEVAEFTVQGRALCVANIDGAISVMDSVCPHEGGPLGEGIVEGNRVVCPWHAYAFDVSSGACLNDPDVKAEIFEAKVEGGALHAKL